MTDFAGKNVLVTGAAAGMGRLLAEKISADGAHLVLWDLNEPALAELADGLKSRGHRCTPYLCDVSNRPSVYETAKRVLADCGTVDVLINNAGVVSGKLLLDLSDESIERTFAVNALALFWTTRAFLPAMIEKRQGHIVTIASAAGLLGTPRQTDYAASKHAAVGFDDALRAELHYGGHHGIRTTVVCPYFVSTGMFDGVRSPLIPILRPEPTVDAIIRAIRRNRARLFLPWIVRLIYLSRLYPTWLFDAAVGWLGGDRAMDAFTGRSRPSGH